MKKVSLGFTLIELLVVLSIMILLFGIGLTRYNTFNRRQILNQAALKLKNNLRLAQSKAFAAEKPSACGSTPLSGHKLEFIDNKNYQIVAVCGSEVLVKSGLSLGQNIIKISGPSSILFKVLAQGVEGAGTITISLPGVGDKTVTVTKTGEIK